MTINANPSDTLNGVIGAIAEGLTGHTHERSSESPLATVRRIASDNFVPSCADLGLVGKLVLANCARSSRPARIAMAREYARMQENYVAAYSELLNYWGRAVRAPFTIHSMTIALTALNDGLVIGIFLTRTSIPSYLLM